MHTSEVSHVKTVEEFYKSIREQQEVAHGKEYCDQHDAIIKYMKECNSYKELGTHQGATAACVMLLKPKYIELVDINHYKYRWKLQELAEPFCKENNIELDDTISEETTLEDGKLPKGIYKLQQDITFDKEDADSPDALEGDEVQVFEPVAPTDTVLGVEIFPVIHIPTQSKIFVSAEDIKEVGIEDLEL